MYRLYSEGGSEDWAMIGFLIALYGVLTALSVLSLYALTQRYSTAPVTASILGLTIITLWASTTTHVVTMILWQQSVFLNLVALSDILWTYDMKITVNSFDHVDVVSYEPIQSCASTVALAINVALGDAIVCWRTCVVWQGNRAVRLICGLFLLATVVLGLVDTPLGCRSAFIPSQITYFGTAIGSMFEGLSVGLAACVLSLSTNLLATLLVGYRAWESRRRLRGYFVDGGTGGSQVEKLFSLLIESGAVYCAIWVVVVAWQVWEYKPGSPSPAVVRFLDIFGLMFRGALVPIIAIYPAFIIVLVASRRSHIEKALTHSDIPTPHLSTISLEIIPVSHRVESRVTMPLRSEFSAIDRRAFASESGDNSDSASEEQDLSKAEGVS